MGHRNQGIFSIEKIIIHNSVVDSVNDVEELTKAPKRALNVMVLSFFFFSSNGLCVPGYRSKVIDK